MYSYFEKYFGTDNYISDQNEMFVKCPFPHTDPETGKTYLETRPSAHVNLDKNVFHCKVCKESHSEVSFFAKMNGTTYRQALEIINQVNRVEDDWTEYEDFLKKSKGPLELIKQYGWENVYEDLRLGYEGAGISFPIIMNDVLMGSCRYVPDGDPKTKLSKGTKNLIFPFDNWDREAEYTLLTAGFKDCTTAISKGYNAITFTHGEGSLPKLFKHAFKGKKVYIAYDNDPAGKQGAIKTAVFIKEAGGFPYIVDLSIVCAEHGEDIHDFFHKYKKGTKDLDKLIEDAKPFDDETYEIERNKEYPLISLEESTQGKYHDSIVSSRVVVTAKWEHAHQVPEFVEFEKITEPSEKDFMMKGEIKTFALDEENIKDLLYLTENEDKLRNHLKRLAGVPQKESGVVMRVLSRVNVFQAVVVDDISTSDEKYQPFELHVYSVGESLASGEKARIFYKAVPHPLQDQRVVGIIIRKEESDIDLKNFKVTDEVKESLRVFQTDNVKEKMKENAERIKAVAGVEILPQIAWTVDLFFNTPLDFYWHDRKERAYLDVMLIGESRTGKSQTAKSLLELYDLGIITSLKGATKAGIIGGSDQTAGGYKTKLGVLPRNHRGAVVMEEFSGAPRDLISSLTDIRSSNMVRIDRVNGTTVAPAKVRMLTISNQRKGSHGETIPLRQQSSGVEVVVDLVGAAEDIGRYDFFILIDKPDEYTDPNERPKLEAFPIESYRNRIRWIWSRKPEQINIPDDVKELIVHQANRLNKLYDCHINFFGPEAWKKLTRVAIAVAGMCVSTEDFETLDVKPDHVEWAKNFLIACYDNELFNLKGYVDNERKYTTCPKTSVNVLQGLYNQHKTLIIQMSRGTEFSQRQLQALSGLDNKDFNKVMNTFAECYFIRYTRTGDRVIPTERFRQAFKQINNNEYLRKVGHEI